jgi:hypothetical protein
MMPNHVGDDVIRYRCFSCHAEVVFETCDECGYAQSIPSRWQSAYACGRCGARCEIPRMRRYATSTKAVRVDGFGYVYPKL